MISWAHPTATQKSKKKHSTNRISSTLVISEMEGTGRCLGPRPGPNNAYLSIDDYKREFNRLVLMARAWIEGHRKDLFYYYGIILGRCVNG